jgi:DNA-binding response OmpR family regulator
MPGLDGADTLSQIRAMKAGARARVVVVSGRVGPADRWRFSLLGVNDFVAKPTDLRELVETIGSVAERAGWREDVRPESAFGG